MVSTDPSPWYTLAKTDFEFAKESSSTPTTQAHAYELPQQPATMSSDHHMRKAARERVCDANKALYDRIYALPQELVDMIRDEALLILLETPTSSLIPMFKGIRVDSSHRIPCVLQMNRALRNKCREDYYTTNDFWLPDFATYHKWVASVSEHLETLGVKGKMWECTKCQRYCGFADHFGGGRRWIRGTLTSPQETGEWVKVNWGFGQYIRCQREGQPDIGMAHWNSTSARRSRPFLGVEYKRPREDSS